MNITPSSRLQSIGSYAFAEVDKKVAELKEKGITKQIKAIGVSAQQHGTVYLNKHANPCFAALDPAFAMVEQMNNIFSRPTAPIWMDVSTTRECREITDALGGNFNLVKLTGSAATERFMGPQVRKFWKENPEGYADTAHIALISSFVTSLLTGQIAPVDTGDGFGTNLVNIQSATWCREAISSTAPSLSRKLPELVCGDQSVGNVSKYLMDKYAFSPETEVIVGSGDNPNSLVGLGMIGDDDKKAISLGTSDTYFGYMPRLSYQKRSEGHIFGTADGKYMALICYINGSPAREKVKDDYNLSWNDFSEILMTTPSGNNGRIMLPYFSPEITPSVLNPRVWRFGGLIEEDVAANVRAIAEGQIMSMYLHSAWVGKRPLSVLVTAGGSENHGLLKVISRVFSAQVISFEVRDSAALGAAIRAAHWFLNHQGIAAEYNELTEMFLEKNGLTRVTPEREESRLYHGKNGLINVYEACEKYALGKGGNPEKRIRRFKDTYCR